MSHLKIKELRDKSKEDLLKQLAEFKKELSQLRVAQQASSTAARVGRINPIRKSIARLLTVLNQNERANLRKFYAEGPQGQAHQASPPGPQHQREEPQDARSASPGSKVPQAHIRCQDLR
jgi:ribosomal protein L29